MNDEDAVAIARKYALRAGRMGEHQYLPTTEDGAAAWEPHRWVVDAIIAGAYAAVCRDDAWGPATHAQCKGREVCPDIDRCEVSMGCLRLTLELSRARR